jgi:threonine dehydratase
LPRTRSSCPTSTCESYLVTKLVVEPSGAVPVAALLAGLAAAKFRHVGVIVTGGNIDPALLSELWASESA